MIYEWHIVSFDTITETNYQGDDLSKAVSRIVWKREAQSLHDNATLVFLGKTDITAFNVSIDDFISYENIDEATALSWLLAQLSEEEINIIDNDLVRKLTKLRTTKLDPPWWPKVQ